MLKTTSNIESFTRRMDAIAKRIPNALDKGLSRWVVLAHREAMRNLSGPGLKKSNVPGGAYPVPVRTGHLRRSEDYVMPGRSKHGIAAPHGQAYLVNTAAYASDVHDGMGRHVHFGKREFAADAVSATRRAGLDAVSLAIRAAVI